MPIFEDGCYSSSAGAALIAKALAGKCTIKYTRAAVGKGNISDNQNPKTMSAPADYVMDAKISAVSNPVDGECQVTVQINSNNVEKGFFATGILLYADDPDVGEVPFTYLFLENSPEWIRPKSSAVGKLASFDIIAAVGDVDKVYADIDPDSIVTKQTVAQMIDDAAVPLYIGSNEPQKNNIFWFDTSGIDMPDKLLFLNLVSDNSTEITAEINNTLYGVENAGTGSDSELSLTIY